MPTEQLTFSFSYLRNSSLFSSHWLENRLELEPEWTEMRKEAFDALLSIIELWKVQRSRVEFYGAEQPLEQAFIQPVFERLGWIIFYQTSLQGRHPDYALFSDDNLYESALQRGRTSPEFWSYPTVVADAKAWHVSLDKPSKIANKREYPPEQIEDYLRLSHLNFGILTNGKLWRLIPREYSLQQRRFQTFLELNLPDLLNRWLILTEQQTQNELFGLTAEQADLVDDFVRFYLFFNPKAFSEVHGRKPLITRAIEGSSEYRIGVSEGLKERTFEALRLCVQGFLSNSRNDLNPAADLEVCREQSFVLLYRLLFIMYAEDRKLLPYKVNQTYTNNRSLGRKRDDIAGRLDRIQQGRDVDYSEASSEIWSDLIDLFDLVDRGHGTYKVPAYNGGLFNSETHSFLAEKEISDKYIARIIDQLGRAADPHNQLAGFFRVDYHDLAIQHLGSIYEGLLELHPHYAAENMVVIRKRGGQSNEEKVVAASQEIPRGFEPTDAVYPEGSVYLITDEGERRATGSYYTPDHIVEYIVERTLGPLCSKITKDLQVEISELEARLPEEGAHDVRRGLEGKIESLKNDFDDRVLKLNILDPSMGSGHFLIRACQYLAEEIATHPYAGDPNLSPDESALGFWKRRVVEHCIFGVDKNPMAVELAKLALWLETISTDQPLSFLDHHLRHGNSLFGARLENMGILHREIDLMNSFGSQVEENLPILLEPLAAIREAPSDSLEHVKHKERSLKKFERARAPFRLVGDLWCAEFTREGSRLVTSARYGQAVEAMTRPRAFSELRKEEWFQSAIAIARSRDIDSFHWELEFPQVFFGSDGRLKNSGFDAIVGNPPYDVLSEAESGQDLAAFRSYISQDPIYTPSRRGKNNLYKLFICRSLDLLKAGGILGFITPMAILGDDQAADIRRTLLNSGTFRAIEAFPQKDNSAKRVFREAKLSTAVIIFEKGQTSDSAITFVSRVHPANTINSDSPSLELTRQSIPLYDPSNFTIVSCSQLDWDLATRMMQSGRLARLGQFASFSQGEVNETNERARGTLISGNIERGKLVTRGASVCLYLLRDASQGQDLFLSVRKFLRGKGKETKAYHFKQARIGLQESSPQNNFRRIIAAYIPAKQFCNHTINYCTENDSTYDLHFVLALLNTKLCEWYFRLGSTNAHVSQYQLNNLPCPDFSYEMTDEDRRLLDATDSAIRGGQLNRALELVQPALDEPPFKSLIQSVIVAATNRIIEIERARGQISRSARSRLATEAQLYQDFIDAVFYKMAGISETEAANLEERLSNML